MFPKRASARRSLSVDSVPTVDGSGGASPPASSRTPSGSAATSSSALSSLGVGALTAPSSGASTPVHAGTTPRPQVTQQKSKFRRSWAAKGKDYNFNAANDILGIVMLEIQSAKDLPKLKNSMWFLPLRSAFGWV